MNKVQIKGLIKVNNDACENIKAIEDACKDSMIRNDKDKANFGNLCIALRGFCMVADATEAILINENVLKGEDGNFYQKIEDDIVPPSTENKPGSDYDADANITTIE